MISEQNKKELITWIMWIVMIVITILTLRFTGVDISIVNSSKPTNETAITNEVITNVDTGMQSVILTGPFQNPSDSIDTNQYPSIRINKKIKSGKISFNVSVNDSMKKSGYLKSDNYCFSFRFFIGDLDNGGYYNVFRNANNGVSNDQKIGLNGCIPGVVMANSNTRSIPLSDSIIVANNKDNYGYHTINTLSFLNDNVGKEVNLGGYLSSVKEIPNGWMFTMINNIVIEYEGDKDAIEPIK